MYRVIIANSKNFNDFESMTKSLNNILSIAPEQRVIIVVSGTKEYCHKIREYSHNEGYFVDYFPTRYRDIRIVGNYNPDATIVFWDSINKVSDKRSGA